MQRVHHCDVQRVRIVLVLVVFVSKMARRARAFGQRGAATRSGRRTPWTWGRREMGGLCAWDRRARSLGDAVWQSPAGDRTIKLWKTFWCWLIPEKCLQQFNIFCHKFKKGRFWTKTTKSIFFDNHRGMQKGFGKKMRMFSFKKTILSQRWY